MNLELSKFSGSQVYHIMTQTVIPRPIAWVLTQNHNDHASEITYNLAPFSYFNAVSSEPPLLMISLAKKPSGGNKDTSINLTLGAKCVVHIANAQHAPAVTATAASREYGYSELADIDMALCQQNEFEIPRLSGCSVAFNCEVYETKNIGELPNQLIFLKIVSVYVEDSCATTDYKGRLTISATSINPLARLGANQYSGITQEIGIARPK